MPRADPNGVAFRRRRPAQPDLQDPPEDMSKERVNNLVVGTRESALECAAPRAYTGARTR
jgi:hypothetical protein